MNENTFQYAWFRRDEDHHDAETFLPMPLAQAQWREDQMHGVAVSGLLARELERAVAAAGRTELVPARYGVDLFRPARMIATRARAEVIREGPRLMLLDAVIEQEGEVVARASATFLKPTRTPGGEVWSPGPADRPSPPPAEVRPERGQHHVPLMSSAAPWSDNFTQHQNAGRHATWQTALPIVLGEPCTPFQAVASIADATSMVTNWGDGGVEYINTDIGLALTRLPEDTLLGLRTSDHIATEGIAVGTAEVYDDRGVLGIATVTSVANTRRTVDFSGSEWDGTTDLPTPGA